MLYATDVLKKFLMVWVLEHIHNLSLKYKCLYWTSMIDYWIPIYFEISEWIYKFLWQSKGIIFDCALFGYLLSMHQIVHWKLQNEIWLVRQWEYFLLC